MNVVLVDPSLFTGRYDDALARALGARGHAVTLAGRPLRATDAIVPEGYRYLPRFHRLSERLPALLRRGPKAAEHGLDALVGSREAFARADVVHWQWLPLAPADRHWVRRLRPSHALVHTVHNARPFHNAGRHVAVEARGYFELLRRFDALIVHGEETAAALTGYRLSVPVHIVPHPPMRLAAATPADLAAVPRPRRPRILFFGTIKPYKGLDLLVEAAARLAADGAEFELALAGQPFMPVEALFDRARAALGGDRLILDMGFLTEGRLDAHLGAADILVFPYRHIDSSGAFLSALDYGAAMVTSDSGMFAGLPAGIARFPAGDASALADALRPLLADRATRVEAARAVVALSARMATWDGAAALTEAAYAGAVATAVRR